MPNGTHIDMCSPLPVVEPLKIAVPTTRSSPTRRWRARAAGFSFVAYAAARPVSVSSSGATMSIGRGKTMVEFLSAAITVSVSR